MATGAGRFVWRELMTSDIEGAKAFYGALFGWAWAEMPMDGAHTYWIGSLGEEGVCGVMGLMGSPTPFWASYLRVDDVDATTARVPELGGALCLPPRDIPGVGRFSMVTDPAGAPVMLFQGANPEPPVTPPGPSAFCWESCRSTDPERSRAFYEALVGWTSTPMMPGMYLMSAPEGMVADLGATPAGVPSHWSTHVAVADLAATRAKVEALGGTILAAEVPVPGFGRMCTFQDPQGAYLSIFQAG